MLSGVSPTNVGFHQPFNNPAAGFGLLLVLAFVQHADAKVPPKLVKVAQGAQKALVATRYGHAVIPLPKRIELETRLAHRVTSHGPGHSTRRKRRRPDRGAVHGATPKRRRPTRTPQHYRPQTRYRRPQEAGSRPRPYYREEEPEYQDLEDEYDEEYLDDRRRPVRSHHHTYRNKRKKPARPKYHRPLRDEHEDEEEGAYSVQEPSYLARPRPYLNFNTKKLYSSSIRTRHRDHDEDPEEEFEESEEDYGRLYSKRQHQSRRVTPPRKEPSRGYVPQGWTPSAYNGPQDVDIGFGQGMEAVAELAEPWPNRLPYATVQDSD